MFHISLKNTSGWVLLMQQNSKNSKLKTEKKNKKQKKKKNPKNRVQLQWTPGIQK